MDRKFSDNLANRGSSLFPLTRQSLLVRLYGDRDQEAWSEFYAIYSAVIFRMGRRRGLTDSDADDTVSIVMRSLAQSFGNGHSVKGRLRHYLRVITNRAISAQLTGDGATLSLEDILELPQDDLLPDEEWMQLEEQERLHVCVERLRNSRAIRPRDLAAFDSLVFDGESVKTVAKRFCITPNRVHGIRHKIIKALKEMKLKLDIELGEV
jgi:RNA polymerase sigma factor (sigma-70 family)